MASETSKKDKKASQPAKASLNMDELRELADLVDEHGFTDFEFENEKIRVRLSKNLVANVAPQQVVQAAPQVTQPQETAVQATPEKSSEPVEDSADTDDGLHKITSPIVGTFYRSPSPDKPPYVKEGDTVSADSIVCIVEAMKLMNEIQAETSGEIVKIYVENAQPVEFGQPLFGIKQ